MEVTLEHVWPEWEIEGSLGSGGYGKVYKAVRRDTGAKAAIKIVSIPDNQSDIDRLVDCGKSVDEIKQILLTKADSVINEIRVMQRLKGANNIVAIEDSVMKEKNNGLGFDIFMRMELLIPLKTHFSRKHVTSEDVVKLGCDICSALEVCHKNMTEKRAIIHRDIKPDNILYHKISDSYKLGDFGISREMANEDFDCTRGTGTANFMAPEVASLKEYDTRADLYSLGLVLYYLLNGQQMPFMTQGALPVPGEAQIALRKRISGAKLDPPINSFPQLTAVILKACAFSPEDRYPSATEMKRALQSVNKAENISANPHSEKAIQPDTEKVGSFGPKPKKRKRILGVWIFVLIILAAITSARFWIPDFISLYFGNSFTDDILTGEMLQDEIFEDDKVDNNFFDEPAQSDAKDDFSITDEASFNTTSEESFSTDNNTKDAIDTSDATVGVTDNTDTTTVREDVSSITDYEPIIEPNTSRNSAWSIEFAQPQNGELNGEDPNWYKFVTGDKISAYRIAITKAETAANMLFPQMYVAVYDAIGIKLEEFKVWSDDEYALIDLYLESNTEYFIKIYLGGRFNEGNYELCIAEMLCDAGTDKDSATELLIDAKNSAVIDSTLSDWHVFRAMERGEYRITLHNIDVGCDIYMSVKRPESAGEGISVANEDNYSWTISVNEDDSVYFEVYSYNENPIANGQYIIEIEKEVK